MGSPGRWVYDQISKRPCGERREQVKRGSSCRDPDGAEPERGIAARTGSRASRPYWGNDRKTEKREEEDEEVKEMRERRAQRLRGELMRRWQF